MGRHRRDQRHKMWGIPLLKGQESKELAEIEWLMEGKNRPRATCSSHEKNCSTKGSENWGCWSRPVPHSSQLSGGQGGGIYMNLKLHNKFQISLGCWMRDPSHRHARTHHAYVNTRARTIHSFIHTYMKTIKCCWLVSRLRIIPWI